MHKEDGDGKSVEAWTEMRDYVSILGDEDILPPEVFLQCLKAVPADKVDGLCTAMTLWLSGQVREGETEEEALNKGNAIHYFQMVVGPNQGHGSRRIAEELPILRTKAWMSAAVAAAQKVGILTVKEMTQSREQGTRETRRNYVSDMPDMVSTALMRSILGGAVAGNHTVGQLTPKLTAKVRMEAEHLRVVDPGLFRELQTGIKCETAEHRMTGVSQRMAWERAMRVVAPAMITELSLTLPDMQSYAVGQIWDVLVDPVAKYP